MPYPGRNNIYEATIKRMVNEAMAAQEQDFVRYLEETEQQKILYRDKKAAKKQLAWQRQKEKQSV